MTRRFVAGLLLLAAAPTLAAQEVSKEYRVKAAFLYNFVKYVEWPAPAATGPIVICVAGRNPFGGLLADTVRGETVAGRTLDVRVILEPDPGCHVMFVPSGAPPAYVRAARGTPTLTVGESSDFIGHGGLVRFYVDGGTIRFEINRESADRSGLRISSRLLQLARIVSAPPGPP